MKDENKKEIPARIGTGEILLVIWDHVRRCEEAIKRGATPIKGLFSEPNLHALEMHKYALGEIKKEISSFIEAVGRETLKRDGGVTTTGDVNLRKRIHDLLDKVEKGEIPPFENTL